MITLYHRNQLLQGCYFPKPNRRLNGFVVPGRAIIPLGSETWASCLLSLPLPPPVSQLQKKLGYKKKGVFSA